MLDKMRDNAQSWVIKVLFAIIIAAFIFAFSGAGGGGGGDTVMAYVKGEPISVVDFQRALAAQDDTSVATRSQLISYMARNELFRQLTAKNGIVVTNAELQAYIRSLPNFQNNNGEFDLARYKGIVTNTEAFETETRDQLLKAKMARFLALPAMPSEAEIKAIFMWQNEQTSVEYTLVPFANYLAKSVIDPKAVQAYYDDNLFLFQQPERSVFKVLLFTPEALAAGANISDEEIASYYEAFSPNLLRPRTVSYREVVIPVGANPTQASVDAASAQVAGILKELAAGASFETLAAINSRPGDKDPGGLKSIAFDQLPTGLATALTDLDVGGISQPAFTKDGLTIVKLESDEAARPLTIEEARQDIVRRLGEEKAAVILDDKVEEVIGAITQGKDMAGAAEAAEMQVVTTEPMTSDEFKSAYGVTDEDVATIFAQEIGTPSTLPVRLDNGYLLATHTQTIPTRTLPLENVRGEITAKLILEEARRRADIDAQAILAGENPDISLIKSQPFTRNGPAPVTGATIELINDAFATPAGKWLPKPYAVAEGFLVAKADARIEPAAGLWEEQRSGWLQTAGEITRRELNMSFQQHIFQKAEEEGAIEIVREDLLQ